VTERNASLLFRGELGSGNYDALQPVEEKEKLGIFDGVCFYSQQFPKTFPPDSSTI
jgi:hypothetical protein